MSQNSTEATDTEHLHAGERITLDEVVVALSAAATWLQQVAIAAERPAVPVELEEICGDLHRTADDLTRTAKTLAEVDAVITDRTPLMRTFGKEPWGAAAHGLDRDEFGKRLSTVLTPRQILGLARTDSPWRFEQAEPGIAYLDGLDGLPDLDRWESQRGARRRAAEREERILAETTKHACPTCQAKPDAPCKTKNGWVSDKAHQPRRKAAIAVVDGKHA